jgi:hypothetical protein
MVRALRSSRPILVVTLTSILSLQRERRFKTLALFKGEGRVRVSLLFSNRVVIPNKLVIANLEFLNLN